MRIVINFAILLHDKRLKLLRVFAVSVERAEIGVKRKNQIDKLFYTRYSFHRKSGVNKMKAHNCYINMI